MVSEKEMSKLKRSLGQKLRHNEIVWDVFVQAYEQCLKEGFEFPFGADTVEKWKNHSKDEIRKMYEHDLERNKYSFRIFYNFFLFMVEHPTKVFRKQTKYLDSEKRFWTLSAELMNKIEEEKEKNEELKLELLDDTEINEIKIHLQKKGSWRKFINAALKEWFRQTGKTYKDFQKFCYYPYDKKFWEFAKEFEKTFDFETNRKRKEKQDYQKWYFQANKEAIYAQRKISGYAENIHEKWNRANAKYRNKVCLYQGNYYYLEQLRRKIGKTKDIKKYILSDLEQNKKCLYNGKTYEFWELCYELRKQKKQNPYEIALKTIIE